MSGKMTKNNHIIWMLVNIFKESERDRVIVFAYRTWTNSFFDKRSEYCKFTDNSSVWVFFS